MKNVKSEILSGNQFSNEERAKQHKSESDKIKNETREFLANGKQPVFELKAIKDKLDKDDTNTEQSQQERVVWLETQLSGTNKKLEELQKSMLDKEQYLKDMIKSTSQFLDTALNQERSRITGIADKTANVLLEKKEYELALKSLKEEHDKLKEELINKENLLDKLLTKNSQFVEVMKKNEHDVSSIAEMREINSEFAAKIAVLEEEISKFKMNSFEPIKNENISDQTAKPQENRVAQESLRVINTFIGWLGEPAIQVDMEQKASGPKPDKLPPKSEQTEPKEKK
jgi:chromosome segregation ATPase